jgi:spore protease
MDSRRTDLAIEAQELWQESADEITELPGVESHEYTREGCPVTKVKILDERGAKALGKPPGTYVTVTFEGLAMKDEEGMAALTTAIAAELSELLPEMPAYASVLVAGLGNRDITPDAVGPFCLENTVVTRHLVELHPEHFGQLRPVAALAPGVLGSTGIESADVVRSLSENIKPACVILVDALASRKLSRLCKTVQLADSGLVPGGGVGNARAALTEEALQAPVISVGVPTVVEAGTLVSDLLEKLGHEIPETLFKSVGGGLIVTPKEIDTQVRDAARVTGKAISLALQPSLKYGDLAAYLS